MTSPSTAHDPSARVSARAPSAVPPDPPVAVSSPAPVGRLPHPAESGIEHVVVVVMENRSFDHVLGWLPGADGRQAGLVYPDRSGTAVATYPLAPDYQGCGHPMPDHSTTAGLAALNGGACDGWLRAGTNDRYAIGYYRQDDLAFLGQAAPAWTTCDHYFAAIMSETIPNRLYLHAAQTDRVEDSLRPTALPTIWDRLASQRLAGRYYCGDIPFLLLWGPKYLRVTHRFPRFLTDCRAGRLPQVAYVDPHLLFEDVGASNDDHPFSDVRNGECFLKQVYDAVTSSPAWPHTVLVITFDEWGGFFDHVAPEEAPDADPSHGLRGFRVPCLLISPWSRRGSVNHTRFDHTSILRLIEWRWGLDPLTPRDAAANNLALALDFQHPCVDVPTFAVPAGPFGRLCAPGTSLPQRAWLRIAEFADRRGWTGRSAGRAVTRRRGGP